MKGKLVKELEELNERYYGGQATLILYRCHLLSSYIIDISMSDQTIIDEYSNWLDVCEETHTELIESIIEYYRTGTIQGHQLIFAEKYPFFFSKGVNFLLGKKEWHEWNPPEECRLAADASSKHYTAQMLEHLLTKDN